MLQISFQSQVSAGEGALALLCFDQKKLSSAAQNFNQHHKDMLEKALKTNHFKGKKGETLVLSAPCDSSYSRIVLIGLGDAEKFNQEILQNAGGTLVAALCGTPDTHVEVQLGHDVQSTKFKTKDIAAHMALGAQLRRWRFDKYRTTEKKEKKPALESLTFVLDDCAACQEVYQPLEQVAHGVCLTRELITEPPNVIYPASYAERLKELTSLGVEVEILGQKELEKLGMGALLGVAQGSMYEGKVVVLQWKGGNADQAPLAFVGKGVTFDTGGICIKPSAGMADMKYDMGGSAVVAGLIKALAGRHAKINAVGVLGLVENMPSGTAQRPSDVVKSMSGQTIEVLDTDAEGRLVLADALWYTQDRFKPKLMIDLATLTGAIGVALGTHYAGLFSNNDNICQQLVSSGDKVGEWVWRLPLGEKYDAEINSDIADVKNLGPRGKGGSITAAQFLARFVNNVPWAHLDIASVTWDEKSSPLAEKGATGYGVRLLNQFICDHYEECHDRN
ncbi:MAG: leucyl aminopeptidase [Janthinobacterium lividum]